jgi:hypothetical protein
MKFIYKEIFGYSYIQKTNNILKKTLKRITIINYIQLIFTINKFGFSFGYYKDNYLLIEIHFLLFIFKISLNKRYDDIKETTYGIFYQNIDDKQSIYILYGAVYNEQSNEKVLWKKNNS